MCAFPVFTDQTLGCSAENCLMWALVCMHFPGLSCSGSGSLILHKGTDLAGPAFAPRPCFRGLSSSGDQFPVEGCDLSPPLSQLLSFLGVQPAHLLRRMLTVQNPKKSWLAMKPACSLADNASLGPQLPPSSSGCPCLPVSRGGWAGLHLAISAQSFVL